jgi:hypothetical protein
MKKTKEGLFWQGKTFHILLKHEKAKKVFMLNYMVTREGSPNFMYQLAFSIDPVTSNHEAINSLTELGFKFVKEMIIEGDFSRESGYIRDTDGELNELDWRELPEACFSVEENI